MKKFLLVLGFLPLLCGCIRYSSGEASGYVYAVDGGILWDHVWIKPSLQSATDDCYVLDNADVKNQLQNLSPNQQVKIKYSRHLFTLSDKCGPDEVTSVTDVQ